MRKIDDNSHGTEGEGEPRHDDAYLVTGRTKADRIEDREATAPLRVLGSGSGFLQLHLYLPDNGRELD